MPITKKSKSPIQVGNAVLIRTVTHYHTGKIVEILPDHLVLEKAAWIADTGRFSQALESGNLNEVEPFKAPVAVFKSAIIDITTWNNPLPESVK
jgi:hypothetical protein